MLKILSTKGGKTIHRTKETYTNVPYFPVGPTGLYKSIFGNSLKIASKGNLGNSALFFILFLLKMVSFWAEDYDVESAQAHVSRLRDIVACTSFFGAPAAAAAAAAANKGEDLKCAGGAQDKPRKSSSEEDGEMSGGVCPSLGAFYDFFSLSHLIPPLQCKRFHPHPSSFFFSWSKGMKWTARFSCRR